METVLTIIEFKEQDQPMFEFSLRNPKLCVESYQEFGSRDQAQEEAKIIAIQLTLKITDIILKTETSIIEKYGHYFGPDEADENKEG